MRNFNFIAKRAIEETIPSKRIQPNIFEMGFMSDTLAIIRASGSI